MRKISLTSIIFFLLYLFLFTPFSKALSKEMRVKIKFSSNITAPSIIEYCREFLWVYSVEKNGVFQVSPVTGKTLLFHSAKKLFSHLLAKDPFLEIHITALGCRIDKLLVAGMEKGYAYGTHLFYTDKDFGEIDYPEKSEHIRDIHCFKEKCIFIDKNTYTSSDLKNFEALPIPSPGEITRKDSLKELNPFENWQDKHVISKEQYMRALITKDKTLYLMDPLRVNIVTYKNFNFNVGLKKKYFIKWGKWGGWEGQMMFPRSITFLDELDKIAISDSGLKYIFIFEPDGDYWDKIEIRGGKDHLSYPIDIASRGNIIYAADFRKNRVLAIEILEPGEKAERKAKDIDDLLHKDLFKRPEVVNSFHLTRCLSCHDGLLRFNLDKFTSLKNHHPTDEEYTEKIDLPLMYDKLVSCSTCHNSHHISIEGKWKDNTGKTIRGEIPYYLRKEYKPLCTTCHKEKTDRNSNHIELTPSKKYKKYIPGQVDRCSQCHTMHNTEKKLLKMVDPDLCFSCHDITEHPITHTFGKAKLDGEEKTVTCFSCHGIHGTKRKMYYARHSSDDVRTTCLSCHSKFEKSIGSNMHLDLKKYESKIFEGKDIERSSWPGNEKVCLDCHNPHEKQKNVRELCLECHENKPQVHKKKNPITLTPRAKGIKLENERITCTTCHEHHGLVDQKNYLREREKLLLFCSSCHDKNVEELFDNYHKISLKDKKKANKKTREAGTIKRRVCKKKQQN